MTNSFVISPNAIAATKEGMCRAYTGMDLNVLIKSIQIYGIDSVLETVKRNGRESGSDVNVPNMKNEIT